MVHKEECWTIQLPFFIVAIFMIARDGVIVAGEVEEEEDSQAARKDDS